MTSELKDLLTRVQSAMGSDRELSFAIDKALWAPNYDGNVDSWYGGGDHPTGSLDKALALAERVLPGWKWGVGCTQGTAFACDIWRDKPVEDYRGCAATPALSVIASLLKALLAAREVK